MRAQIELLKKGEDSTASRDALNKVCSPFFSPQLYHLFRSIMVLTFRLISCTFFTADPTEFCIGSVNNDG